MKDLSLCMLFDRYAPLIKPKPRDAFHLYYNEDLSLSEIAELSGTTRQAVRDLIARTGEELKAMEAALGLIKKEKTLTGYCEELKAKHPAIANQIDQLIALIKE